MILQKVVHLVVKGLNLFCQNVLRRREDAFQWRLQPRNSQQIAYMFFNAEVIKLKRESEVDKSTVLK